MSQFGGPPDDPNDDDGADPRRGAPEPEPVRVDPLVRLGLAPEPEPEPRKSYYEQLSDLASDGKRVVRLTIDTAGDVLRKEGATSSPTSKLQRARELQQQELEASVVERRLLSPTKMAQKVLSFSGVVGYLLNFWRLFQVRIRHLLWGLHLKLLKLDARRPEKAVRL